MWQKITIGLALITALFVGVILAQTVKPQFNSSNSNSLFNANISANSNIGMLSRSLSLPIKTNHSRRLKSCRYMSVLDVERIVGSPMEFWHEKKEDGSISCAYRKDLSGIDFEAEFQTFSTEQKAQAVLKLELKIAQQAAIIHAETTKIQTIRGVGDDAWIKTFEDSAVIYVKSRRTIFSITISGSSKLSVRELKRVANKLARQF